MYEWLDDADGCIDRWMVRDKVVQSSKQIQYDRLSTLETESVPVRSCSPFPPCF